MPETVSCNLCGSTDALPDPSKSNLLNIQEPIRVCSCRNCGLMYLNPRRTVRELSEMYHSDPYYSVANAGRGLGRLRFYHAKWARLERLLPSRGKLLGIGCLEGGYVLQAAQERGWDVTAVEFSSIMAGYASRELKLKAHTSEAWDLSCVTGTTFDAAFSLNLEHVSDARLLLRQCRELLVPGGLLFLEVPNQFNSLVDTLKLCVTRVSGNGSYRWFHRKINFEYHLYYFVPRTIRALLEKEGYKVLQLRTYLSNHPIYHGDWTRRWLQEAVNAAGGLIQRGPCIELIARKI